MKEENIKLYEITAIEIIYAGNNITVQNNDIKLENIDIKLENNVRDQ